MRGRGTAAPTVVDEVAKKLNKHLAYCFGNALTVLSPIPPSFHGQRRGDYMSFPKRNNDAHVRDWGITIIKKRGPVCVNTVENPLYPLSQGGLTLAP